MAVQNEGYDWRQSAAPRGPVSADRADYAAMSQAARDRYNEQMQYWADLFDQRTSSPLFPKVVERDISEYVDPFDESRRMARTQNAPVQGPIVPTVDGTASPEPFVMPVLPPGGPDFQMPPPVDFGPPVDLTNPGDVEDSLDIENRPVVAPPGVGVPPPATEPVSHPTIEDWRQRIIDAQARAYGVGVEAEENPVHQTAGYKTAFWDPLKEQWVADRPEATDVSKSTGGKHVFFGWENYAEGGGFYGAKPITMDAEYASAWMLLPEEFQQEVMALTYRYYEGMSPDFSWIEKRWNKAVSLASLAFNQGGEYLTPFDIYTDIMIQEFVSMSESNRTIGGGRGYGFGGGGGGGTISLTSPSDALYLLNQAMTQYLGRRATEQELRDFVAALNSEERANPTTVTYEGGQAVQSGGFNPAVFAQQFAQSQEGSAEFQATTTFMDAFLQMLGGRIGE